jgi:beta-phosphoglucomutase-like phosphatase (HAD superfamily)
MSWYDAHIEKQEKLGREHPKLAPFFSEVEEQFLTYLKTHKESIQFIPTHIEYLTQWNSMYKLIYCTNLRIDLMQEILQSTQFPLQTDILVSSRQVLNAKPEGDIYLKIARLLGIKANTLTIIDSTLNGIQASYLANSKGLYLAQFIDANSTIKKFAYAHFKKSEELNHYVLNLINQSE